MNQEQLEIFVADLGVNKVKVRGNWLMGCCPIHGETNPSWGVNLDAPHRTNCFSCGHQTISLSHLVAELKGIPLKKARLMVGERFNSEFQIPRHKQVRRYEDERRSDRFELEHSYLAPFKSGKETHEYFFRRGFTSTTGMLFSIGFDRKRKRITVPIRYRDGALAGVIGRTIKKKEKKMRYINYEEFPKTALVFPEDLVDVHKNWFIVVEGTFDCMWMHQLGFTNTVALMGSKISREQADWIAKYAKYVVSFLDNDEAGESGNKKLIKYLAQKRDVGLYFVEYPEGANDPMNLSKKDIRTMIKHKKSWYRKKIDRIS